jgi:hypothetical protein
MTSEIGFNNFRRRAAMHVLLVLFVGAAGCASTASLLSNGTTTDPIARSVAPNDSEPEADSSKKGHPGDQAPGTLLAWQLGKVAQDSQGTPAESTAEDTPIKTDRPTFTPSSSTVGKGVIQLETGYTFTHERTQGVTLDSHGYPEATLRFGILADWLEGRITQNFASVNTAGPDSSDSETGAADLLLGVKLGLAKQREYLPETAVIVQMSVPTGSRFLTQKEVMPGIIGVFGWEVIKNCLSVSGSLSANRARDGADHFYTLLAESVVVTWSLTKQLDYFTECYALTPSGAIDSATGPQAFFDTGLTYRLTPNLQLDGRAGLGLNHQADEFFTGIGLSVRY